MTIQQLKISESILKTILWDYKKKLWESPLSDNDKEEIESRFNLLEKATHNTFKEKYENYDKPKSNVGNI